jgi:dTMP kinase
MNAGKFICIDGPNGAGKSTVVKELSNLLLNASIDILITKEPTTSNLGQFIRNEQDNFKGKVLACLVAADRYDHIEKVINPNLRSGKVVISDRYLPSSLVYQTMDGVEPAFIWSLNKNIVFPDLFVFVSANPEIIIERLNARNKLTRFEDLNTLQLEFSLYKSAFNLLKSQGFNVLEIQNDEISVQENAKAICESIIQLLNIK